MQDVVAGHVPLSIASVFVTKPHIDSKRLRPLAVTTSKRSPELPDVPTVAESGYPGYEATNWQGLFAPAKTPPDTVRRIQAAVAKVLAMPDVRERMLGAGAEPVGSTPEEFDAKVRAEVARYAQIVKDARIPPLD
jgi:tripartite-type tricarboxylate transporter receptor subunit TctC